MHNLQGIRCASEIELGFWLVERMENDESHVTNCCFRSIGIIGNSSIKVLMWSVFEWRGRKSS